MMDIPKSELLEKLSAGWTLRRKSWPSTAIPLQKNIGGPWLCVHDIFADDWEGEPPVPSLVKMFDGLFLEHAFHLARVNKGYVKHVFWGDCFWGFNQSGRLACFNKESVGHTVPVDMFPSIIPVGFFATQDWEVWTLV